MRNLSKLVFQRVVAVSVGILLQIGFLIVMATYLRADFFWIRIAMNVLSWAMVIYIISCGVNPSYKIAWIVLILAFPVAGLTIYLLFGGNKISSYEHRKMQSIGRHHAAAAAGGRAPLGACGRPDPSVQSCALSALRLRLSHL